jgi:hypothetical protein
LEIINKYYRAAAIMERVCACLKFRPLAYEYRKCVENRF